MHATKQTLNVQVIVKTTCRNVKNETQHIHQNISHKYLMWKPNLGKTTSNMLLISHSSIMIPYERPTLLKVTIHTVKCDPIKGFQSPC